MKTFLCIALMLSVLVLFPSSRAVISCTDNDGDNDCQPSDCNDNNPDQNSLDIDGDGYTSCVNDCDDNDPNVNRCKVNRQQYPIYSYPEPECYSIHEQYKYYRCPQGQSNSDPFTQCVYVRTENVWSTQCL